MAELDDKTYTEIQRLSKLGNELADEEKYSEAIEKYSQAYALLPEPKKDWEASTWLLASIGDMHFELKNYKKTVSAMYDALNCPAGIENPFIYLRLGESLLEINDLKNARENLLRAYMLEGEEIFENEDAKYLNSIKDII
jgi:tetratricopeptide (TPR) repeat protein